MLDIRFIRENTNLVKRCAKEKGYDINIDEVLQKNEIRNKRLHEREELKRQLNEQSKSSSPTTEDIARAKKIKLELEKTREEFRKADDIDFALRREVPNVFPDDTPLGAEDANREERKWGDTADKDFKVLDHVSWAEQRGLLDFERGAKVAGNKFYYTTGSLVQLEMGLTQMAMKQVAEQKFIPMMMPHLVSSRMIDGTGFTARSKEEEQIYRVEGEDLHLIATAEIPLTAYHADEILDEKALPKLYAGYSPSYRKEAGAYGKHSKGLYRVHQFNKVEMYIFCKPQDSEKWHQKMIDIEEKLCQILEIPYRVVRIAAGELGAAAYKKYDVEYWSPVDKSYRELMSCSNVTDYQSRRLNIRYREASGETQFVHTLNGTAAAMSRLIIAIIENHQTEGGKVGIPTALRPYMGGQMTL